MKVLVLGGTGFVGRHVVERALSAGMEVTLLNRGLSHRHLFPGIERLTVDRWAGMTLPPGRRWDAAIDVWAISPFLVGSAVEALAHRSDTYVFISSVAVYRDADRAGSLLDESAPLISEEDLGVLPVSYRAYGLSKALSEGIVGRNTAGAVVIRSGRIVGPYMPEGFFTAWLRRMQSDEPVLAPLPASRQLELIDVRDLAELIILLIQQSGRGTFNVAGPERPLTAGMFFDACRRAAGGGPEIVFSDAALTGSNEESSPLHQWRLLSAPATIDNAKAIRAGLRYRPLEATLADCLARSRHGREEDS